MGALYTFGSIDGVPGTASSETPASRFGARNARAVSRPISLYSFSNSASFCRNSGPTSFTSCWCSTSFNLSDSSRCWSMSAVPSLDASSSLRSVSARWASRARFACAGEDASRLNNWVSKDEYRCDSRTAPPSALETKGSSAADITKLPLLL